MHINKDVYFLLLGHMSWNMADGALFILYDRVPNKFDQIICFINTQGLIHLMLMEKILITGGTVYLSGFTETLLKNYSPKKIIYLEMSTLKMQNRLKYKCRFFRRC